MADSSRTLKRNLDVDQLEQAQSSHTPEDTKEEITEHNGKIASEEPTAKRLKTEDVAAARVKGVAPVKEEYLIAPSGQRTQVSNAAENDDEAEAKGPRDDRDRDDGGRNGKGKKDKRNKNKKGQNTARHFGSSNDAIVRACFLYCLNIPFK